MPGVGDTRDLRVDAYIGALSDWQQAIFRDVRVHAADPEVEETIRTLGPAVLCTPAHICAFLTARDHVNVFIYDGAIVRDPEGIIKAGHDNETARTVGFRQSDKVNARALSAMFKHVIANNRAGGWRKLKNSSG